jgi:hypothetical protein
LNLSSEKLVFTKFAFNKRNLCRYASPVLKEKRDAIVFVADG